MDQRQTQIREGAGLEESRLNTDLIDFLRKWSTPMLLVVVAVVAAYVLKARLDEARQGRIDAGFAELAAATVGDPSPDSLRAIAEQYAAVPAVRDQARMEAADAYLRAAISGLKPGATLGPEGAVTNPEDAIAAEERGWWLEQAAGLYEAVWAEASDEPRRGLLAAGAAFGMAAVEEMRGSLDAARQWYGRAEETARAGGYGLYADIARERAETARPEGERPRLLARAELPTPPRPGLFEFAPALDPANREPAGGSMMDDPNLFGPLPTVEETPVAPEDAPAESPGDAPVETPDRR